MADELDIAAQSNGDGMPIGNQLTPLIQEHQVEVSEGGKKEAAFEDDAMATIIWEDFQRDQAWLNDNSWLAEWQYIDYLYQSPNFDRGKSHVARISRFNVAKNSNTMRTQVRRGIFADQNPFLLEATGALASDPDAQTYLDAATEILKVLDQRADFEYFFGLLIDSQALQGTGIANMGWEEKTVVKKSRVPNKEPEQIEMPDGSTQTVHTLDSDDWTLREDAVTESWPFFEYRRLGTTIWDEQWRTPNRPDLSAKHKIDIDYVNQRDLAQMRKLECYKDIPSDEDLMKYFLARPYGDAEPGTEAAETQSGVVMHATNENETVSKNPFEKPMMKLAYWTSERVGEMLCYDGRRKIIRNGEHELGDHALGCAATWWNIDNCGYGVGIGRINAGDQRMNQGVLNEVLKMIGYWTNAPILYNTADGNAPTQNIVAGLGTMWAINAGSGGDVRKALAYAEKPAIPAEAWKIMELAQEGGADEVGANSSSMQGNVSSTQGMARTAAGVNRSSSQADAQVSDPIAHLEGIIVRWNRFKWQMVCNVMPMAEIRSILKNKFDAAIVKLIDAQKFLNMEFNINVLAGQKLAAKAQIAQLIPFLLQLLQQPQLMEYMHQKGKTVNFLAIERIFMRVSELQGADDIIVDLTDQEKQMVQQMNPNAARAQAAALLEKLRGQNKLQEIQEKGKQDVQHEIVKSSLERIEGSVPLQNDAGEGTRGTPEGPGPLDLAEARLTRNTDMAELQQGVGT